MSQTFTGIVQFANGAPAANVTVRLFDADTLSEDDDLTVRPGLSDAKGYSASPLTRAAIWILPIFIGRICVLATLTMANHAATRPICNPISGLSPAGNSTRGIYPRPRMASNMSIAIRATGFPFLCRPCQTSPA